MNSYGSLWLLSLSYSLPSWAMGCDIRTVFGPWLSGVKDSYTFEDVSQMSVLTLSNLWNQHWTWLFLRGLLLHLRQVTFGFLWLMFLLLLGVINGNTAENADSSQPVNLKWEFIPPPCWLCGKLSQCSDYFYWTSVSHSSIKFFLCFLEPMNTSEYFLPHGRDRTWRSFCWRLGGRLGGRQDSCGDTGLLCQER